MASKFQKGDVVVLKSGGPPMTVDEVPRKNVLGEMTQYHCRWFKGATADSGYYAEHLLQAYEPPAKK